MYSITDTKHLPIHIKIDLPLVTEPQIREYLHLGYFCYIIHKIHGIMYKSISDVNIDS